MRQGTNPTQKRLKILGEDEIVAIYQRPHFTPEERMEYFSISSPEKAAMEQLHSIQSKIYSILPLGDVKARHRFFSLRLTEVSEETRYIIERYFPNFHLTDLEMTQGTRLKQRRFILSLCGYRLCGRAERQQLEAKARQAASVCCKPISLCCERRDDLTEQRIVAPGDSFMQETVGQALTYEHSRLITLVRHHLPPTDLSALKHLLDDSQGLYEITLRGREPNDFSWSEMKREIDRAGQRRHWYHVTQRGLPHLFISNESLKYYASLVTYYSVFRLKQVDEQMGYLYLLCLVYHRYQRLHDNLINSLIHHVRRSADGAQVAAQARGYE